MGQNAPQAFILGDLHQPKGRLVSKRRLSWFARTADQLGEPGRAERKLGLEHRPPNSENPLDRPIPNAEICLAQWATERSAHDDDDVRGISISIERRA